MKNKIWRKCWFVLASFACIFSLSVCVYAEDVPAIDGFQIIPELDNDQIEEVGEKTENIWKEWWKVRENYNKAASGMSTSEQIASWIMNWDTIVNYLVYMIKFISQLWLVVWVAFIMYAWYKYMISVFNGWKTASTTIKNAIIWVIIVIFSYAIMKILTSLVWLS